MDLVQDISEGGVSVETQSPLEPDQLVSLCLGIPFAPGPIDVLGRVVWSTPRAMGIRFVEPEFALYQSIRRLRREYES